MKKHNFYAGPSILLEQDSLCWKFHTAVKNFLLSWTKLVLWSKNY